MVSAFAAKRSRATLRNARRPALLARELGVDKVEPVQQLAALTAEEDEPIVVSQREGFRLLVAYRSERGLDMLREVVGITD